MPLGLIQQPGATAPVHVQKGEAAPLQVPGPFYKGPPLGQAWASAARQGSEAACGGLHPCHRCHYSAQSHGPLLVSVA